MQIDGVSYHNVIFDFAKIQLFIDTTIFIAKKFVERGRLGLLFALQMQMDGTIHSLSQRLQCQACYAQVFVEPATAYGRIIPVP